MTQQATRSLRFAWPKSERLLYAEPKKLVEHGMATAHEESVGERSRTVYTITDYHIGAYSFKDETGEEWDLKIAENTLYEGISDMMAGSPDSEQAIFCQMGDFLHWDGLDAVTPMHGHILEGDTRKDKLIEVAIRVIRRVVKMLLKTHNHVHLLMAEGNHDLDGSAWLRQLFAALYDNELGYAYRLTEMGIALMRATAAVVPAQN